MEKVNIASKLASFSELWSPRRIATVDDHDVKVARLEGEFVWHRHDDADELFLLIEGSLTIELRDGAVELSAGELVVIPRGVEHRPVAVRECQVLLFERRGVVNTGDADDPRRLEQIDSI